MPRFTWTESPALFSSGELCQIGKLGQLKVYWHSRRRQGEPSDPEPYTATVFNRLPKDGRQFKTADEAKAWCERTATEIIRQALKDIEWDQ